MTDHAQAVRAAVSGADRTTVQNALMRMPDKVCAAGLALLAPEEREPLYALIAPAKAARVREEILLEKRRRTTAVVRGRIAASFLSYFGQARAVPVRAWIRPKKPS